MGTIAGVIMLVGLAGLFYLLWERWDKKRESVARKTIQDLSEMGEQVAPSLSPKVDPDLCIGSGACVRACPEKGVIALVGPTVQLVNPLACVGHGACAAACPVSAIQLVYGTKTRGVELPKVDPNFETSREGVYIIGELGGMGLIRNAVKQGRQAAEHVILGDPEVEREPRRGVNGAHDAIVVGAGPAGIAATLRLMEEGLDVRLLERDGFGGTILHYPRAKVVMTGALDFPLYGKVKSRTMSKEELVEMWEDILEKVQPPVHLGELVEGLTLGEDGMWTVRSNNSERRAANVVLALGVRGSPRKLGVPGEEMAKVAYRLLEPTEFADKHVLVVGGGNSAVESALALADAGVCKSVALSYRKNALARCRGDNRERIEQAFAAGTVTSHMPSEVDQIMESELSLKQDGKVETIPNDAVIVQIGGTAPASLLKSFGLEIVTKYGEA